MCPIVLHDILCWKSRTDSKNFKYLIYPDFLRSSIFIKKKAKISKNCKKFNVTNIFEQHCML